MHFLLFGQNEREERMDGRREEPTNFSDFSFRLNLGGNEEKHGFQDVHHFFYFLMVCQIIIFLAMNLHPLFVSLGHKVKYQSKEKYQLFLCTQNPRRFFFPSFPPYKPNTILSFPSPLVSSLFPSSHHWTEKQKTNVFSVVWLKGKR